jgi:hypothetical protein
MKTNMENKTEETNMAENMGTIFYAEELEQRFEMAAATPSGNFVCWHVLDKS